MIEFFKWWFTDSNGNEYMTFLHCALMDYPMVVATGVLSLFIVIEYFRIAYFAFDRSRKYESSITKSYLIEMMNVFMFCAVSGYGYILLSIFVNPYKLRVLLLLVLLVWSYRFRKTMLRTNVIDRIFQGEKLIKQKIAEYNKTAIRFQGDNVQDIKWEDLVGFVDNEWVDIKGIRFKLIKRDYDRLYFITEVYPNGSFGAHQHSDCKEYVKVLKSELIDDLNSVHLIEGEDIIYDVDNSIHSPRAEVFSIYEVIFTKK